MCNNIFNYNQQSSRADNDSITFLFISKHTFVLTLRFVLFFKFSETLLQTEDVAATSPASTASDDLEQGTPLEQLPKLDDAISLPALTSTKDHHVLFDIVCIKY